MSTRTIDIGGLAIRYFDKGEGPCLLFLHGWGVGFDSYSVMLTHLARTHRVVAPNLPGMGGSQEPPSAWEAADYVAFVRRFVSALALDPAVLMGHSNGGRVILKWLGDPETALPVPKIVLMDSAGLKVRHSAIYYLKVYSYKAAKLLLTPFPQAKRRLQKNAGSADYRAASPVMRATMSRLLAEDLTPVLPRIRASTLLLWGDCDTATPLRDGRTMERLIPGAGLVVLKGGGHWAALEQWGLCARVLDSFLSQSKG